MILNNFTLVKNILSLVKYNASIYKEYSVQNKNVKNNNIQNMIIITIVGKNIKIQEYLMNISILNAYKIIIYKI